MSYTRHGAQELRAMHDRDAMVSRGGSAAGARARLVGRTRELAALRACVRLAIAGNGQAVLVEGEAGIGKTRVAQALLGEALGLGVLVRTAEAQEFDRDRPFGILVDAFDLQASSAEPSRARLGQLLSPSSQASASLSMAAYWEAAGLRSLIADGIVSLIEQETSSNPAILVLEDLQWADDSTLLVLHRLLKRVRPLHLMLLGTSWPAPKRREMAALRSQILAVGGLVLELGPLDQEETTALAASILQAEPDASLAQRLSGAAGNPFYLTELVLSLQRENALMRVDGHVGVESSVPPRSLRALILDRLAYLPEPTWELLQVASIFGSSFTLVALARATGRTGFEVVSALQEAIRDGLLVEVGNSLEFHHDLVRDAIYFDTPLALRTELHSDIAHELLRSGASPVSVAMHASIGAHPGDSWAISSLREAAASPTTDPKVAAGFLRKASELAGPDHPDRDQILTDLMIALMGSGRLTEAEAVGRQALCETHEHASHSLIRRALSQALLLEDRLEDSVGELEAAATGPAVGISDQLAIRAEISYRRVLLGDLERGATQAQSVIDTGFSVGAKLAISIGQLALSHAMFYRGYLREAVDLAKPALDAARRLGNWECASTIDADLGIFSIHADRFDEADALHPSSEAPSPGWAAWQLPRYHYVDGYRSFYAGDWETAVREFQTGLDLADELGIRWWSTPVRSTLSAMFIRRGQLHLAGSILLPTERNLQISTPDGAADYVLATRALLAEAQGDADAAAGLVSKASELVRSWGMLVRYRRFGPDLVRLLRHHRENPELIATVEALEAVAARANVASVEGAALLCRGMMEADADVLLAAVAAYRKSNRPVELAFACEEAAAALSAAGDRLHAAPLFHEAVRMYDRIDARRDRARTLHRMRETGVRIGSKERHRPAGQGWDSLTAAELNVVRLTVEGLSNKQIAAQLYVSPRTVETHLSHVFSKLGLRGRMRLAIEATARVVDRPH